MTHPRTEFDLLLERVLERGILVHALRKAHRSCKRLIPFSDFYHDVLLKSLERGASFRGRSEGELVGWMRTIGSHLAIDLLRRSMHRRFAPLPPQLPDPTFGSPHEQLVSKDAIRWMRSVVEGLDDLEREIIRRHYFEGCGWTQIAEELGIKHNTVIKKHLRLIEKLRALRSGAAIRGGS